MRTVSRVNTLDLRVCIILNWFQGYFSMPAQKKGRRPIIVETVDDEVELKSQPGEVAAVEKEAEKEFWATDAKKMIDSTSEPASKTEVDEPHEIDILSDSNREGGSKKLFLTILVTLLLIGISGAGILYFKEDITKRDGVYD